MKKYIIILAATVCALCACQKHEIELLDKPIIEQIDGNTYTYTFSAVISDNVSEVEEDGTKATVSRAGAFTWVEGDKLKFFPSEGEPAEAEVTDVSGSTATITVTTGSPRSNFVSAIYPADAALSKNQISFNARGPIVVADIADGGTLTFHHIGSLINLKFYDIAGLTAIKSLVFEPASAFGYDGSFTFDGSHVPSLTATGTTSKIVVPASSADNNSDITVVVPSVSLSGFSAALNDKADGTGRNLFKKSTATAHDLASSRPVLMNMKRVAYEAPSKLLFASVSTDGSWDVEDVVPIQTGANEYTLNLNTSPTANYYFYDEYNDNNKENGSLAKGNNSNVENNFGSWKIIGDAVASDWTYSNGAQLKYFGQEYWSVLKNRTIASDKYFKIAYDGEGVVYAAPNDSYDVSLNVGEEYNTWKKYSGGGKAFKITTAGTYDIYFRYNNDSDTKIILAQAAANFGEGAAIYTYHFNSSSNTATSTPMWGILDKPFYDASILTNLRFIGYSAGWGSSNTEISPSSSINDSYWVFDVVVSSIGTLEYKFKKSGDSYSAIYNWGLKDSQSTNAGANLYGSAVAQNETGNNTTTALTAGTYKLYVNAYSWYGNRKLNYMFVKQ